MRVCIRVQGYIIESFTNWLQKILTVRAENFQFLSQRSIKTVRILFGSMSNSDRGIFLPLKGRPVSIRHFMLVRCPLCKRIFSAAELLRTDLLNMSTKEFNTHKNYSQGSFVLVHYTTGAPPLRFHTYWRGPMRVVNGENSRYTLFDLIKWVKRTTMFQTWSLSSLMLI